MNNPQNLVGQWLGQYRVDDLLDSHGLTTIYKAQAVTATEPVALKILPPFLENSPEFNQRFLQTGMLAKTLQHPHILPIYEVGQDQGQSYIVMRYLAQASTLADYMRQPISYEQVGQYITQIASALDYAHQQGIVHADVKPSNILITRNQTFLSDFGLVDLVTFSLATAGDTPQMGTPAYLAPEQTAADQVVGSTDIYALAVIAYELLTGQIPHQAESPMLMSLKRQREPAQPPSNFNPTLSSDIDAIFRTALATEPGERYQTASQFATALQQALTQLPKVASPNLPGSRPLRGGLATGKLEWTILGLLGLIGVCGLGMMMLSLAPGESAANWELVSFGLVEVIVSLSCLGMLWLRDKRFPASAMLSGGVIGWFLGAQMIGIGVAVIGSDVGTPAFRETLTSMSFACLTPGLIAAVLGLLLYTLDQRRLQLGTQPTVSHPETSSSQATASTAYNPFKQAAERRAEKLQKAADYRTQIGERLQQQQATLSPERTAALTDTLEKWDVRLENLVAQVNAFEENEIIQRDIAAVPGAIAKLTTQIKEEADEQVAASMTKTLGSYQQQQHHLQALIRLMRRTELEIDDTVATIGTIYSQLQVLGARQIDNSRAQRLSQEIQEEADRLGDLLHAMDEVYQESDLG